jgi:hypothetical protein
MNAVEVDPNNCASWWDVGYGPSGYNITPGLHVYAQRDTGAVFACIWNPQKWVQSGTTTAGMLE